MTDDHSETGHTPDPDERPDLPTEDASPSTPEEAAAFAAEPEPGPRPRPRPEVEEATPDGGPLSNDDDDVDDAPPSNETEAEADATPADPDQVPPPGPGADQTGAEPEPDLAAETPPDASPEAAPEEDEAEPEELEAPSPAPKDEDQGTIQKASDPASGFEDPFAEDEEEPQLVWYVLKVQSGREDTIRGALDRRVKIEGLDRYFGAIVVPKEKVTEMRNGKKRTVERKSYPGYLMVNMELNEKTWFVVRETPGVGDFVGAHGTPTPMSQEEIDRILKPAEEEKPGEAPKPRIDLEQGDKVKIKEGPFEGFEGTVEEVIEARGLVKVMIVIFNRNTPVDLEYWQVERL